MTKQNLPPRLLYTVEAGRFLGLSARTLEKHRYCGSGPAYLRLGGRVVYKLDDLVAWSETGRRWCTDEQGMDLTPRYVDDDNAKR